MDPLVSRIALLLASWPAPYSPPGRAELAAAERAEYLPKLANSMASAAHEATCTGPWAELECRRRWPGSPEEISALAGTLAWFESRLDPRIQAGDCQVWGRAPGQIECDGVFLTGAGRFVGITKRTRWGLVGFRAASGFQFQGLSEHRLNEVVGLGEMNLYEASREAMSRLAGYRSACRAPDWATCVVSAYAGTISYRQAPIRVAFFRRAVERLEALRSPENQSPPK